MATMKAVQIKSPGDASQLHIDNYPKPTPKPSELLIKVKSFGLNRMDIWQRHGQYPPPPGASEILGVEIAGVVEEVGSEVNGFKIGDKVFGLMGGGGYAEYAVMDQAIAIPLPSHLTFQEAASIPEVWFTAYQALHFIAGIKPGETILIHAGASGVGTSTIQLAKLAGAKEIYVTAGSDDKIKYCESLGATKGFNYKKEDWAAKVLEATQLRGADVVIDFIGKDYWNDNMKVLAQDGRMVILAFLSGHVIDKVDISVFLRKRIRVEGSGLRSRSLEYQTRLRKAIQHDIVPSFDSGELRLVIDRVFNWTEIQDAHRYLEGNTTIGKVIVNIE